MCSNLIPPCRIQNPSPFRLLSFFLLNLNGGRIFSHLKPLPVYLLLFWGEIFPILCFRSKKAEDISSKNPKSWICLDGFAIFDFFWLWRSSEGFKSNRYMRSAALSWALYNVRRNLQVGLAENEGIKRKKVLRVFYALFSKVKICGDITYNILKFVATFASHELVFDHRVGFMKTEENKEGKDIMLVSKRVYRTIQAVQTFSFEEKRQFIKSLLFRFSEKRETLVQVGEGLCSSRTKMLEG